jgi:hypothetical protein
LARRFFDRFEPVHAVTYFAPESRGALDGLGFPGFWMGYFAARSAPFGIVPTEVVTATFYNFTPERVAKALPAAWEIASPADCLQVRVDSAVAALRRYGVTDDEAAAAMKELSTAGLNIGESGAAALAGLRALQTDPRCSGLRHRLEVGRYTRALLVASEGITGAPAPR